MAEVALDLLASQEVKLLEEARAMRSELGQVRDDIRVMAAIVQRLDGTVQELVSEVRVEHSRHDRLSRRVDELETSPQKDH